MAKPLVEHKSTVKAPKPKRKRVPKGPDDNFNVVSSGGSIRRIVFDGIDNEPEPEPAPAPREELPDLVDFAPVRQSRVGRRSSMDDIHSQIDHLAPSRSKPPVSEAEPEPVHRAVTERTTSRSERSAVDALLERVYFTDVAALEQEEPEAVEVIRKAPVKRAPAKKAPAKKPAAKKAPAKKAVAKKPAAKKAPAKKAPAKKAPAKKAPAKKTTRGPRKDYKGDVHEVVDLEGIGPTYASRLKEARITNTQELLFASNARLEKITNAKPKTVQNWKDMAQLVKIKGIGPQFAEAMVRSGLGGIEELKKLEPKAAVAQIKAYLDGLESNVLGSGIGLKRMTAWQTQAKGMRKVAIDLKTIEVVGLESRQAISTRATAAPKKGPKKAPAKEPAAKKPVAKKAAARKAPVKKTVAKAPAKKATTKPAAKKTASKVAAKKPAAKKAPAVKSATCAAQTAAGKPCKRPARDRSKYCASHKGYRA